MNEMFSLTGRTALVTGASGAIGGAIARGLAGAGADLVLTFAGNRDAAERCADAVRNAGRRAEVRQVDLRESAAVRQHALDVEAAGGLDILVNCAGGNVRAAITGPDLGFFDLPVEAIEETLRLNVMGGAILPCLCYGRLLTRSSFGGSIINISSMNALRPLEGRPAYAASKAAVSNFTQWLACHVARHYDPAMRVNAIAPGFFPNERMRDTLFAPDGEPTERGRAIIAHTPMGRLGDVEELVGTAIWLASDASRFVTGTVIPVDGGFNAYAGV